MLVKKLWRSLCLSTYTLVKCYYFLSRSVSDYIQLSLLSSVTFMKNIFPTKDSEHRYKTEHLCLVGLWNKKYIIIDKGVNCTETRGKITGTHGTLPLCRYVYEARGWGRPWGPVVVRPPGRLGRADRVVAGNWLTRMSGQRGVGGRVSVGKLTIIFKTTNSVEFHSNAIMFAT